jgi:hypothetical protein
MRLLSSVLPQARRLVPSAERGLSLFLVTFVIVLELLGRQATNDVYDAVAGLALMSVFMFVLAWHRRYPLPWLAWANRLAARVTARLERLKYEIGVDFRGTPPFPRKLPRLVSAVILGLVIWSALAVMAWSAYPDGWREIGLRTSYVAYLAVLMVLWAALAGCALAGVYLPVWVIDQRLKLANNQLDPHGVDAVALIGYLGLAMLLALFTPPVYAVAVCLIVALGAATWYVLRDDKDVALLWRAEPGLPIYAVPLKRMVVGVIGVGALLVFALLVTASGGRLTATPSLADPMPLTALLGSLTAWLVPGVLLVLGYQLWEQRRTDPSRVTPPTAHIAGRESLAVLRQAGMRITRWGWKTRLAPTVRESGDVGIELVSPEQSEATEFEPRWPLKVSMADLQDGAVRERLERRDEIQLRRQFYAGLAKLLKRLKAATPTPGGGYWIAPHWWFIETVQWEEPNRPKREDMETLRPIGPGFDQVFPTRVRQHLYRVLRATEIDLIYLEDGVSHRKVEKVLRSLFEVYDIHGGRRKVEDHHFRGVPKVRVMIHEYSPGNPFKAEEGYPEPKFDEVSRFRVLHVFKDRGGQEEELEAPFDFSWEPSPALAR